MTDGDIWLWLDDVRDPKDHTDQPERWTWVKSVAAAKRFLATGRVVRCSLDHDLGMQVCDEHNAVVSCCETEAPSGYDLCVWMAETGHWPRTMPTVHSANPCGAARMRTIIAKHWHPVRGIRMPVWYSRWTRRWNSGDNQ